MPATLSLQVSLKVKPPVASPAMSAERSPAILAAVAAGGALGGVARYEIGLAFPAEAGGFPWATWGINVVGSFALGVLVTLVVERWPPTRYVRPFLGVGLCGGFTTWSTFMVDSTLLVRDDHPATAAVYLLATIVGGVAATIAGMRLARVGRPAS